MMPSLRLCRNLGNLHAQGLDQAVHALTLYDGPEFRSLRDDHAHASNHDVDDLVLRGFCLNTPAGFDRRRSRAADRGGDQAAQAEGNGNDGAPREPREGREGGRSRGGRGRRNDRGPRLDEAGNPIPAAQGQDEANGQANAEGGASEGADNRDSNGRRSRDR